MGPDYQPPATETLGLGASLPSAPGAVATEPARFANWWTRFHDPVLDSLVTEALANNTDLAAARSRLARSEALAGGAKADLFPTVSTSASAGKDRADGVTVSSYSARVGASWEIDLFGGIRRSVEAANADAEGQAAALQETRLQIVGETARRYIDARLAQERLRMAEENLKSLRTSFQIVEWRAQAGMVEGVDVEQARQLVAQTEAALPALRAGVRSALNRLAVLTGTTPGSVDARLVAVPETLPQYDGDISDTLPLDILRRRPDVAVAERSLAAETARIGVAKAALLPSLTLNGSLASQASSLSDLGDTIVKSISAVISETLFDGGRRKANIRAQEASVQAALAGYRGTVLTALEDTDNAYQSLASVKEAEALRVVSQEAADNTVTYRRIQYRSGLIDITTLLEAERTQLSSSDSLLQARAQIAQANITLIQALGGDAPNAQTPADR